MKYCQQCGKELTEGAKFCGECGTAVAVEPAAEEAKTEPSIETVEEPKVVEQAQSTASGAQQTQNTTAGAQQTYGQTQYQQPAYDPRKSRTLAGILGIIFGCFGVHNFYLGYTAKAVIQLCVSLLGLVLCCVGIGVFVITGIAIWGLVEGIMILAGSINVDGKGVPLKD